MVFPRGGLAKRIAIVTDGRAAQGGPAISVYGYDLSTLGSLGIEGGPAMPVKLLADADLVQNGGKYWLEGDPVPMSVILDTIGQVEGGPAIPIYLLGGVALGGGIQYVTLPQNLATTPETEYLDFQDVALWPADLGTCAADTTNFLTGTQGITLTTPVSDGIGEITYTLPGIDLSSMERISFWVYYYDPPTRPLILLRLSSTATPATKNFNCYVSTVGYSVQGTPIGKAGSLHLVTITKPEFTAVGGEVWTNSFIRCQIVSYGQPGYRVTNTTFDSLRINSKNIPAVMLWFDDGWSEEYINCFTYMRPLGIRGTLSCISGVVGTSGYLGWTHILEMQAAGWTIANHTDATGSMSGQNEATQEGHISACRTALVANGLTGGNYLVYPSGYYDAYTVTAMTNLGILAGRGTNNLRNCVLPPYDIWNIESDGTLTSSSTLANATDMIDKAIAQKTIISIIFHAVGSGTNYSIANFQGLMDYIKTKWSAGLITPLTMDDYYTLTSGSLKMLKNPTIYPPASKVLQQDLGSTQLTYDTFGRVGTGTKYLASSFTANATYTLGQVDAYLRIGAGTPLTSALHCYIYSDNGSHVPNASLGEATATRSDTLTTTLTYYSWNFAGIALVSGTRYWIVLMIDTPSDTNYPRIGGQSSVTGQYTYKSTDGITWTLNDTDQQNTFHVYKSS